MTLSRSLALLLAAIVAGGLFTNTAAAQASRSVSITLNQIRILDEDDPVTNDEPYLIVTRFRLKTKIVSGKIVTVPGTLQVLGVTGGHNNLGRRDDNWADEVHTYNFPAIIMQDKFAGGEAGWVFGAVVTHMEEDAFTNAVANLLSSEVHKAVKNALERMTFEPAGTAALTEAVTRRLASDLSRAIKNVSVGGIIRGLASAVDPDDYGGSQIVLAVTAPGNKVFRYMGPATANPAEALGRVQLMTGTSVPISLDFPAGDLRALPGNARFQGHHRVLGTLRIW